MKDKLILRRYAPIAIGLVLGVTFLAGCGVQDTILLQSPEKVEETLNSLTLCALGVGNQVTEVLGFGKFDF
jgi:hypothetical protein